MKKVIYILVFVVSNSFSFGQDAILVEKSGSGDPILFLPGFTTPGSVWEETRDHLKGSYESHFVSYAGFNGIAPIGTPWYSQIKDALVKYVEDQQLANIILIGHSMGGNLAVDLAAQLGPKVKKLVLVDSLPCMRDVMMPGVSADALAYDSPYNNQMLQMPADAFKNVALSMAQNMTNQSDSVELLAQWSIDADRETYVYGYTDLLKLDLRPQLAEIKPATLILGASFPSKEIAFQTFQQQYQNLAKKEIVMADDSKHFIMFDQPEWFYNQLNDYLAAHAQ